MTRLQIILWLPVGYLLVALMILMTGHLFLCYYTRDEGLKYDWDRAITKKAITLFLVPLSLVMDFAIFQIAIHLPQDFRILDQGYLFLTLTTVIWLIAATVAKIIHMISGHVGEDLIPPVLKFTATQIQWVVRNLRKVDDARFREVYGDAVPKPHRWLDDVSDEEAAHIVRYVARLQRSRIPTDPRQLIEEATLADGVE